MLYALNLCRRLVHVSLQCWTKMCCEHAEAWGGHAEGMGESLHPRRRVGATVAASCGLARPAATTCRLCLVPTRFHRVCQRLSSRVYAAGSAARRQSLKR